MEEQEDKQPPQRISLAQVEQVNSDFIMELAMQQQEHEMAYTMLETIESDSGENENLDSSAYTMLETTESDSNDIENLDSSGDDSSGAEEFSRSQQIHSRWDFLADEEEIMDEDANLDLDEMNELEFLESQRIHSRWDFLADEEEIMDEDANLDLDEMNELEFSESQRIHSRWDFLADDEENTDEDDDLDLGWLTNEELSSLGELIGEEKRGLSVNEIPSCLHPSKFQTTKNRSGLDRCVICQVEYEEGEELAVLSCEHPYHPGCVSKWLQIKRVCPICGTEVSSPKASKNA